MHRIRMYVVVFSVSSYICCIYHFYVISMFFSKKERETDEALSFRINIGHLLTDEHSYMDYSFEGSFFVTKSYGSLTLGLKMS